MEQIIRPASNEMIKALDAEFEARKKKILATKSEWTLGEGGKVYYIANGGSDENDGLSEDKPLASFAMINEDGFLNKGDVVLMKRGDVWHERITAKPYVTYSAYGDGDKPKICGSIDASKPSDWKQWGEHPYVYKYTGFIAANPAMDENGNMSVPNDVGNIVFNHGEYFGARIMKYEQRDICIHRGYNGLTSNGKEFWYRGEDKFADANDLRHNLEYYFNHHTSELFICSLYGNPGEIFDSIELCMKGNVIRGTSGVTLDNLAILYGASHGMGAGTAKDLIVRNCEVGWIGGSIQFIRNYWPTRFGNSIEIFGGCDNYQIYDNYIYQAFDCGPTIQWQGHLKTADNEYQNQPEVVLERDIMIHGNAIERCDSPMEVWLTTWEKTETSYAILTNIRLYNNLCRYSGYGFGGYHHQKCDYNMFYGAGETKATYENAYIENNFMWYIRLYVHLAVPTSVKNGLGFNWRNNVIIKPYNSEFSMLGEDYENAKGRFKLYPYNDETIQMLIDGGCISENKFYHHMRYENER
ncbi:MAG: hypothetical protein IJ391_08225 [Clostridia bacterium]|nr:hypothetical protein [Clostridia bacterium]